MSDIRHRTINTYKAHSIRQWYFCPSKIIIIKNIIITFLLHNHVVQSSENSAQIPRKSLENEPESEGRGC